jgi:hypothetical protein
MISIYHADLHPSSLCSEKTKLLITAQELEETYSKHVLKLHRTFYMYIGAIRGLKYTEDKPLGRLCKTRKPFFYEFRVILSANVFQLVCNIATLFTTEAVRTLEG